MDDVVRCPGCDASLTLPTATTGQTVQCPRCRRIFDPAKATDERIQTARKATQPGIAFPALDLDADAIPHRRLDGPLGGIWAAYLAVVLISVTVFSFIVDIWGQVELIRLIDDAQEGMAFLRDLPPRKPNLGARGETIAYGYRVAFVAAAVAFLTWLWQAHANLSKLRAYGLSYTPLWCVVCWFYPPVANMFTPFPVLQEVWRGSHPSAIGDPDAWRRTPYSHALRWWWNCFIAAWAMLGLQFILTVVLSDDPIRWTLNALGWIAFDGCVIAAGFPIVYFVLNVTCRQQERFDCLQNQ